MGGLEGPDFRCRSFILAIPDLASFHVPIAMREEDGREKTQMAQKGCGREASGNLSASTRSDRRLRFRLVNKPPFGVASFSMPIAQRRLVFAED